MTHNRSTMPGFAGGEPGTGWGKGEAVRRQGCGALRRAVTDMPHVLVMCLVPMVPLSCLALVLWLDRLEETLDDDVDRRRAQMSAPQAQLERSLAVASVGASPSAASPASPSSSRSPSSSPAVVGAPADASLGGRTNL